LNGRVASGGDAAAPCAGPKSAISRASEAFPGSFWGEGARTRSWRNGHLPGSGKVSAYGL